MTDVILLFVKAGIFDYILAYLRIGEVSISKSCFKEGNIEWTMNRNAWVIVPDAIGWSQTFRLEEMKRENNESLKKLASNFH